MPRGPPALAVTPSCCAERLAEKCAAGWAPSSCSCRDFYNHWWHVEERRREICAVHDKFFRHTRKRYGANRAWYRLHDEVRSHLKARGHPVGAHMGQSVNEEGHIVHDPRLHDPERSGGMRARQRGVEMFRQRQQAAMLMRQADVARQPALDVGGPHQGPEGERR